MVPHLVSQAHIHNYSCLDPLPVSLLHMLCITLYQLLATFTHLSYSLNCMWASYWQSLKELAWDETTTGVVNHKLPFKPKVHRGGETYIGVGSKFEV